MYIRLKELRDSLGLTQAEFGKSIGIAKSTYNNYETGIRDPKSDFWIAVAQKYGVTIDYLMGFSDNPHPISARKKSTGTVEDTPEDGLNDAELHLMALYRELNPEGQEKLIDLADDLVSSGKYIKSDSSKLGKTQRA